MYRGKKQIRRSCLQNTANKTFFIKNLQALYACRLSVEKVLSDFFEGKQRYKGFVPSELKTP